MIFRKNGMLLSGQHIQFFHVNTVGNAVCPDHFSAEFKIHPFYFLHLFSLKPHLLRFYICPHTVDITDLVIHKIPAVKHIPVEDSSPATENQLLRAGLYSQLLFQFSERRGNRLPDSSTISNISILLFLLSFHG